MPLITTSIFKSSAKAPTKFIKSKQEKVVKPPKRERSSKSGLPFTGGDYWINLITAQPQSASDILKSAIGKLDFAPTEDQLKKLAGRMTFALNALVREKTIEDSGSGRNRRFFKA